MATYKVIQDIEAEDKFLGPLTLKQFIFAAAGVLTSYLSFFSVVKGVPFLLLLFVPMALLGFFLAIPWSRDQPTEIWVLAKLRFRFKPKQRIWSQDGIQELVTITAPKKTDQNLTKNYSQTEVQSRLKTLADTIDSRGWSVKHAAAGGAAAGSLDDDRLISPQTLSQSTPTVSDDIADPMDDQNSEVASKFNRMIQSSQTTHKAQVMGEMESARGPKAKVINSQPVDPQDKSRSDNFDEKLLTEQLKLSSKKGDASVGHLHTIPTKPKIVNKKAQASSPSTPSADILRLSQNNDLDVDVIARQAKKGESDDEVVISLH